MGDRGTALVGRQREQQQLAEMLDEARRGRSGVLVLRGEAGIGKTALLTDLVASASDFRVIHISGAETEMELAYAGVQQFCAPMFGLIDQLPEPQTDALRVALGLKAGGLPIDSLSGWPC